MLGPEDVAKIKKDLRKKEIGIHEKQKIIDQADKSTSKAERAGQDLADGLITPEQYDEIMIQEAEILKAQEIVRGQQFDD